MYKQQLAGTGQRIRAQMTVRIGQEQPKLHAIYNAVQEGGGITQVRVQCCSTTASCLTCFVHRCRNLESGWLQVMGANELQNAMLHKLHLDSSRGLCSRLKEVCKKYLQPVYDAASEQQQQPFGEACSVSMHLHIRPTHQPGTDLHFHAGAEANRGRGANAAQQAGVGGANAALVSLHSCHQRCY